MAEEPKPDEFRFSLQAMLAEVAAEADRKAEAQGPIDQAEILKMVQNRKKKGTP